MSCRAILLCVSLAGPCLVMPLAAAATWTRVGDMIEWQGTEVIVRPDPDGTITVYQNERVQASLAFFQWHENWVYERLERGQVTRKPVVGDDGALTMAGMWGTSTDAPPLAYSLVMMPVDHGVEIQLTVRKTAPLRLTHGIWCIVSLPRAGAAGCDVVLDPTAHAPLGQSVAGPFRRLHVGVPGALGFMLEPDGFGSARSHISEGDHSLEICLMAGDFAAGKEVTVRCVVGEAVVPVAPPDPAGPVEAPLALRKCTPLPASAPQYEPLELTVDLAGTWDNPFDPDDIRLDAVVTLASGESRTIPGFFMVPYRREVIQDNELMLPEGPGQWCVRLTGIEIGPMACRLKASDRTGTVDLPLGQVLVTASSRPGFVEVSPVDPHYLVYGSGAPYLPIGHNLPIYPTSGQLVDQALDTMAAAGENWNRWWMSNQGLGLEWESKLGHYRQAQAAQLDLAMDLARERGLTYMLCMDTHQDFREAGWQGNPFNAIHGGPCRTPQEWFTSAEARSLYRKRLRYIVARWSYSPSILCWEFGNEFEGWADTEQKAILAWHREMASFLRALDPYRHPITTSWWSKTGPPEFWNLPDIDIVQTHCYTNNDAGVAEQVRDYCLHQWNAYRKPHIFGEFGIRSHETTADKDPKGWALHNAAWAAVASGCDGIPMPWWHENYIDPLDLYSHFTAISRFTAQLPFGTEPWVQLETRVAYANPGEAETARRDAEITPVSGFSKRREGVFEVKPDGTINDRQDLLALLHGEGHSDLQSPLEFQVDYPESGNFTVHVGRVSNSGLLRITVDERLALEREFLCGEGHGRSWQYREQWKLWESLYDEAINVTIPKGEHRIRLENHGKDWIDVKTYCFEGCRRLLIPNLLTAALGAETCAILWIQNRGSTWYQHENGEVALVPAATVDVVGLPAGTHTVQWWETWTGVPQREEHLSTDQGVLHLSVPELRTDIGAIIRFGER